MGGKRTEEKSRGEERRGEKEEKNQTQLRLAYPKPKPGKENHKREATVHKPTLLLTKDMSSLTTIKRLSPKPDFLDTGE